MPSEGGTNPTAAAPTRDTLPRTASGMAPERRSERVEQRRRRKIPLACEPCRERKSRCDGAKPICSTCQRRSLPLHQCIYTLENARTASNEAYIKVLHDRIRRLEQTCTDHGVPIPPLDPGAAQDESTAPADQPPVSPGLLPPARQPGTNFPPLNPDRRLRQQPSPPNLATIPGVVLPEDDQLESLDATESTASVTAMGTVSTEGDAFHTFDVANEFYGSSSAASFMKEACTSVKVHRRPHTETNTRSVPAFMANWARPEPLALAQANKFALPPRNLADHLLERFWDRVYCLYPFFHKPTFLRAYESLWRPSHELPSEPPLPGLGLGSCQGADAGTIVFHCALNTAFALGAHFSDLGPKDKATAIETFFNRSKAFVGLDFIDMHNVGVVQSLLLMTLFLQSTPFPSRCWNSVGLACRVGQGLGLHTDAGHTTRPPLETEIRRRTWHACVMFDMIVSMTYGRPTMTAHLPNVPLPSGMDFDEYPIVPESDTAPESKPSRLSFFIQFIRQCGMLGEILSNVYQPSTGVAANGLASASSSWGQHIKNHGMDAILELDAKLLRFESSLPPIMSWKTPCEIDGFGEDQRPIIVAQRTVLHGSFLHLRLMLHRPILTQLCAAESSAAGSPSDAAASTTPSQELFNSFAGGCARICLGAAMDLIELVHETYLTSATAGWWWDGLFAFTAGLAIIVAYLFPALVASLDRGRLERCWMLCQTILAHFSSFSISAQRSLRLLQKVHSDVMSRSPDKDQELPLQVPTTQGAPAHGDSLGLRQEVPATHIEHLDMAGNHLWQFPAGVGADVFGMGMVFNWDQSLDLISAGLGMDIYQ